MPEVQIDIARCKGCGLCVDFCPVEVFDLISLNGKDGPKIAQATRAQNCWSCDTCVGQCPTGAIRIIETQEEADARQNLNEPTAEPIGREEKQTYAHWHKRSMKFCACAGTRSPLP